MQIPKRTGKLMEHRTLGNSGTVVSAYALGTVTFGAEADQETSFDMLDRFRAAGGNFLDTADVYSAGASEKIIGQWLQSRPTEARHMVIASKGRFPTGHDANDAGSSRRHLSRTLDASLSRLGVDHIDLYQLHAWDPVTPLEETLRFLDDAVSAGKIGHYGFSNFTGWQLTKAVHIARAYRYPAAATVQMQYNLLVRGIESEILPAAADAGLGLLAWSPLAGGWLTGKYRRDEKPANATRYGDNPSRGVQSWHDRNSSERTWRVIGAVRDVSLESELQPSHVALAWLAQQPVVTSVILGARTIEQLESNLGAATVRLEQDSLRRLNEASIPEVEEYPYGAGGQEQRTRKLSGGR
jgi:aryl-alcohol dehydrogenase-like predicted oxidoreductase